MKETMVLALMTVTIVAISVCGGYRYGRGESYRIFGVEFKKQVTAAYWDGYDDGGASCERHYAIRQGSSM